jgi:hypothetical protein
METFTAISRQLNESGVGKENWPLFMVETLEIEKPTSITTLLTQGSTVVVVTESSAQDPYVTQTKIDIFCETDVNQYGYSYKSLDQFLICGLAKVLIDVFGLLGNLITLLILLKPCMKSSITFLLIGLAAFDMLLLSVDLVGFALPVTLAYWSILETYTKILAPLMGPYMYPMINVGEFFLIKLLLHLVCKKCCFAQTAWYIVDPRPNGTVVPKSPQITESSARLYHSGKPFLRAHICPQSMTKNRFLRIFKMLCYYDM